MRQSDSTSKWAANTIDSHEHLSSRDIVEEIGGVYKYYCYILADFDPIRARQIFEESNLQEVAEAVLAKMNYNRPPDE